MPAEMSPTGSEHTVVGHGDVEAGMRGSMETETDRPPVQEMQETKYKDDLVGAYSVMSCQFSDYQVVWDGPNDPCNPQNWPHGKKMRTTLLYGSTTMCATFVSKISHRWESRGKLTAGIIDLLLSSCFRRSTVRNWRGSLNLGIVTICFGIRLRSRAMGAAVGGVWEKNQRHRADVHLCLLQVSDPFFAAAMLRADVLSAATATAENIQTIFICRFFGGV